MNPGLIKNTLNKPEKPENWPEKSREKSRENPEKNPEKILAEIP